jgi:AcrR family transcriptional regulator
MAEPNTDAAEARRTRQQRRRDRSRDEILAAARTVLLRDGITAVTLEAVAREAGMSKTGLYYYFASKEALVFELVFAALRRQAEAVEARVATAGTGPAALGAVIGATVEGYASQMDDFRLAYLLPQVSTAANLEMSKEQFARLRPLNDMMFAGAADLLAAGRKPGPIEPRLLTFLAFLSAIGLLTMKGLVESMGDPLLYSDKQMVEALSQIFSRAAKA